MKTKLLFIALFASLLFGACNHKNDMSNEEPVAESYSYTDDYGQVIEVPSRPRRVVSLSPAVTEIVFALGTDSLLVGRTEFCVYPPEAQSIENIGGISNLNIEKVLSLNPDLIIAGSMIPRKVVEQFQTMGVPLVSVIEQPQFNGLFDNIDKIARLLNCSERGDSLAKVLHNELDAMQWTCHPDRDTPPTVYYVVGYGSGGNFTSGGNTFINDIISMSGGDNIAKDSEGWTFSVEALLHADPTFILIRREDSATFCNTAPYTQLTAVKKGRVIALESGMIDLQVPRNIEVVKLLRARFTE